MKYPTVRIFIVEETMPQSHTSGVCDVSGRLDAMLRLDNYAQIKNESAETNIYYSSSRIKANAVEDTTPLEVLPSTPLPAIADTSSASITSNEYASKRLVHLKMEECKPESVNTIMDSIKPNIHSYPDVPRNVRFELDDDDAEDVQPENNRSLQYYRGLCNE